MGFKCGIIGLPNVGKSTLFNALTKAGIAAANYPFCTIEPNVGIVPVPDQRLTSLAQWVQPQNVLPATIEFVDIAGLVAGAAKGEGLGNKFLAHIRTVDAITHVVRCFEQADIIHVAGRTNPIADIETVHTELALADLETAEKALQRLTRVAKTGDKAALPLFNLLEKITPTLNQGVALRHLNLDQTALNLLQPLQFLTLKPLLYLANIDEQPSHLLEPVQHLAQNEATCVIPVCAKLEETLMSLDEAEKIEFLRELGLAETGLGRLIRAGYQLLGLQTFFTAGVKEVHAWTIPIGTTAIGAAGRIHTDFMKGFIRAEVIAYEDFVRYRSEQGAKEAGKWRLEGKDYLVQDGDIMHFRFNV